MREPLRSSLAWRKSGASGSSDCVEVAEIGESILIRDSKDPAGPILTFTHSEWNAFVVGIRNGEFDSSAG